MLGERFKSEVNSFNHLESEGQPYTLLRATMMLNNVVYLPVELVLLADLGKTPDYLLTHSLVLDC